jgi:hypothetical protein
MKSVKGGPESDGERQYVDDRVVLEDEDEERAEVHERLGEVVPKEANVGRQVRREEDEPVHLQTSQSHERNS